VRGEGGFIVKETVAVFENPSGRVKGKIWFHRMSALCNGFVGFDLSFLFWSFVHWFLVFWDAHNVFVSGSLRNSFGLFIQNGGLWRDFLLISCGLSLKFLLSHSGFCLLGNFRINDC